MLVAYSVPYFYSRHRCAPSELPGLRARCLRLSLPPPPVPAAPATAWNERAGSADRPPLALPDPPSLGTTLCNPRRWRASTWLRKVRGHPNGWRRALGFRCGSAKPLGEPSGFPPCNSPLQAEPLEPVAGPRERGARAARSKARARASCPGKSPTREKDTRPWALGVSPLRPEPQPTTLQGSASLHTSATG